MSSSAKMEHTPTPWKIYDDADPLHVKIMGRYPVTGGAHIADVLSPANAAFIVTAVNSHADLREAMKGATIAANLAGSLLKERDARIADLVKALEEIKYALCGAGRIEGGVVSVPFEITAVHSALSAANVEYSGYSCNGVNLIGDRASIKSAMAAFHSHAQADELKTQIRHWREECGKLHAKLSTIASIAEGSETLNSLPHIAKIARGEST